jgi:hemolysin III
MNAHRDGEREAMEFPAYSPKERLADGLIHALGVVGAGIGGLFLVERAVDRLPAGEILALAVYALSLSGMLLTSTTYHLLSPGRGKEILRRVDHAMIYALIAGTYTPFAVRFLEDVGGNGADLLGVWCVALTGVVLKLTFPRRFERFGLGLYLGLGWAMAVLAPSMWASIALSSLILLATGGVLYTLGSVVHHLERLAYHNAVWHALVVIAAGCHFAAIVQETVL